MLFTGNDFVDTSSSFDTAMKAGSNGALFVRAYATSGALMGVPKPILWHGSGYAATALHASIRGVLGIANDTVASGCVGWFQIRGYVADAQGGATCFAGSYGHAVYWGGATGLGCSSSAFTGISHMVAIMAEDVGGGSSTTANIYLIGKLDACAM